MQDSQIFPPPDKKEKEEKVQQFAEDESIVLFHAKSVFPFSLFPDRIVIHPNKVDVVIGEFFKSHYIKSFFLPDIASVEIVTTPFMATIRIAGNKPGLEPIDVRNLKRKDAIKIKETIDGMMLALRKEKELGEIKSKKSLPPIQKAGKAR